MKVAIAQINTTCGAIQSNLNKALEFYDAVHESADVVVFPELTLTGYPPEDLLYRKDFLREAERALDVFAEHIGPMGALIGLPTKAPYQSTSLLYNSVAYCEKGQAVGFYHKQNLPNYGVFDEKRYFLAGNRGADNHGVFFNTKSKEAFGVSICEDIWVINSPVFTQARTADVLINMSASPYNANRQVDRIALARGRHAVLRKPIVYCNLVGGQDELVFDGNSFALSSHGVIAHAKPFKEDLVLFDTNGPDITYRYQEELHEIYEALVLGTRDYVQKNGFHRVLIGLSGGIDSALVATIAVDALGKDNVIGVLMPSRYSSKRSLTDAWKLAVGLGITTREIPIEGPHMVFEGVLKPAYEALFPTSLDTNADENVQARIRGVLLMALSNQSGAMVLTTGNKSEMAMGYATLYGDMCGGFAVIKDVPKTTVFDLCNWLNKMSNEDWHTSDLYPGPRFIIPQEIIDKPPSAELRPDQKDTDSLPEYEILDRIIEGYVEQDLAPEGIWRDSFKEVDLDLVQRVCRMIDRNEYKRRQAPPGVRISPKAFGKDRRLPIVNGWTK